LKPFHSDIEPTPLDVLLNALPNLLNSIFHCLSLFFPWHTMHIRFFLLGWYTGSKC